MYAGPKPVITIPLVGWGGRKREKGQGEGAKKGREKEHNQIRSQNILEGNQNDYLTFLQFTLSPMLGKRKLTVTLHVQNTTSLDTKKCCIC